MKPPLVGHSRHPLLVRPTAAVSRVWGSTSVVVPLIMVPLAPPAADAHRVWKKPEARVMIEDERLADPGFLVHTDPGRVRKLLNTASSLACREFGRERATRVARAQTVRPDDGWWRVPVTGWRWSGPAGVVMGGRPARRPGNGAHAARAGRRGQAAVAATRRALDLQRDNSAVLGTDRFARMSAPARGGAGGCEAPASGSFNRPRSRRLSRRSAFVRSGLSESHHEQLSPSPGRWPRLGRASRDS
jgi:hypothetical protein